MKNSRIVRTGVVILFAAALAGSISYQSYEKRMQVECIMTAADELDKLVNLHFQIATTDECEEDGVSGVATEVWADLDSKKWVAVYSKIDGESQTVYQSQMYDGKLSYGLNDTVEKWTELAEVTAEIPYYSTLDSFYYEVEDFSDVVVTKKDNKTLIEATLSEDALEKVYQDAVDSANQTYLTYVEDGDEDGAAAAEQLLECAKQTQITGVKLSYTIDAEGLLCSSTYTEYYSRPAIQVTDGIAVLGEMEEHVVTTTREVLDYNSEEATTTLHKYLGQLEE